MSLLPPPGPLTFRERLSEASRFPWRAKLCTSRQSKLTERTAEIKFRCLPLRGKRRGWGCLSTQSFSRIFSSSPIWLTLLMWGRDFRSVSSALSTGTALGSLPSQEHSLISKFINIFTLLLVIGLFQILAQKLPLSLLCLMEKLVSHFYAYFLIYFYVIWLKVNQIVAPKIHINPTPQGM